MFSEMPDGKGNEVEMYQFMVSMLRFERRDGPLQNSLEQKRSKDYQARLVDEIEYFENEKNIYCGSMNKFYSCIIMIVVVMYSQLFRFCG